MDAVDWLGGLAFLVYDMYFGDNVVSVTSASELCVSQGGGGTEGGAFTYGTVLSAYDRINKRLSVSMSVGISISSIAKANSMFGVGAVAEYQNHSALRNDACFSGSVVYEPVLAHEMAHANSFFSYEKLRILSGLYELEGRLQSSSFSDGDVLVCDIIRGVIDSNEARYSSNMSANSASRAWFDDKRNGWIRFYDSSELSKWRKEE